MIDWLRIVMAAIVGALATMLVGFVSPRLRRWNLTRQLSVRTSVPQEPNARCIVRNAGYWTVGRAGIYISLDIEPEDVVPPPDNQEAFVTPSAFAPIDEAQLCWSVRKPEPNPMTVDILAKKKLYFSPFSVGDTFIRIPSEEGWDGKSRVFLRRRTYHGIFKFVTADTNAKELFLTIDPQSPGFLRLTNRRCSRREIPRDSLRRLLDLNR